MTIKENAIFIADAHYNDNKPILKDMLLKIKEEHIVTSQLFLMGDIFDFLEADVKYFKNKNKSVVDLINDISKNIEVIYLEGNHDFNLKSTFKNTIVISRNAQPLKFNFKGKEIAIAHGDIFTPTSYNIFTAIIRNRIVLKLLNLIDIGNWFSSRFQNILLSKKICKKQENFEQFVEQRLPLYNSDLVIEGHYHQGLLRDDYINIPSLCCDNSYLIYQNTQFKFITI